MTLAELNAPAAGTVRIRATVVHTWEYDANPAHYVDACGPEPTPAQMAALDQRNIEDDPSIVTTPARPIIITQVVAGT
jgi:hypothetical protein